VSQYPYQPPQQQLPYGYGYYGQDPVAALLAPAKRASIVMFILAGLMLPCGGLLALAGAAADFSQLPPQQAAQIQAAEQQLSSVGWSLKQMFVAMGMFMLVPGLIFLGLAVAVRRGGMGSVVTSIIFCGLVGLLTGLGVVANLAQGNGCGAAMFLIGLLGLIMAEVFLFQAAGRAGQIAAYRGGGMGAYGQTYPQPGYGQGPQAYGQQQAPPQYPSQQPQTWGQPGAGQWGQPQQQAWGQQQQQFPPPPAPPPPPPPASDRQD
jgi:hypothetical protein